MCGIAGYVQRRRGATEAFDPLPSMLDRLAHRGPDGTGEWRSHVADWEVALGHRRLAIIDVTGGAQPMGNETSSYQITCNGEIYNSAELCCCLERSGHKFRTRCDIESIIHLFEEQHAG